MRITKIILDGFKSYANRMVLEDLDPVFNAITGLNGSGKSNVLDGIVFVLGQNSLSLARVTSLREQIYKSGNAGITQASVSLIFDNTDKSKAPDGYRDFDELTITRQIKDDKSKYYLNGIVKTVTQIKYLFKSVGIDVDNYFRFFVQQGTITKIVSFRSTDIFKLIEETAGTAHFNKEEAAAKKMIEQKLRAIEVCDEMATDVEQKITRNAEKKKILYEFRLEEKAYKEKERFYIAFDFFFNREQLEVYRMNIQDMQQKKVVFEEDLISKEKEKNTLTIDIQSCKDTKSMPLKDKLGLKKELLVKNNMDLELQKNKSELQSQNLQECRDSQNFLNDKLKKSGVNSHANKLKIDYLKNDIDQRIEVHREMQKEYENVLTLQNEGGVDNILSSFEQSLRQAELMANKTLSDIKNIELQIDDLVNRINSGEKSREMNKTREKDMNFKLDELQTEITELKELDEQEEANGNAKKNNEKMMTLNSKLSEVTDQYNQKKIDFNNTHSGDSNLFSVAVRSPKQSVPNWSEGNVIGKLVSLFDVVDSKFAVSLNKIAGGRLLNLVTKSTETNEIQIKHNCLTSRTTMIPLTVRTNPIPVHVVQKAKEIAKAHNKNIYSAMELLKFKKDYHNPIEFVFGQSLIAEDVYTAKNICYHKDVLCTVVTMTGEVFSPQGTVSGGYFDERRNQLMKYMSYQEKSKAIANLSATIEETQNFIKEQQMHKSIIQQRKQIIVEKQNAKREIEKHLMRLKEELNTDKLDQYTKELEIKQSEKEKKDELIKIKKKEVLEFKQRIQNLKEGNAESMKSEYKSRKENLHKEIAKLDKDIRQLTENRNNQIASDETEKKDQENIKRNIEDKKLKIIEAEKMIEEFKQKMKDYIDKISDAEKNIREQGSEILYFNQQDQEKNALKNTLANQIQELSEQISSINDQIKMLKWRCDEKEKQLGNSLKNHDWIADEEENFNMQNSCYYFEDLNFESYKIEMQNKKENLDVLKRKVDFNIENHAEALEKAYKDIRDRKEIIMNGFDMMGDNFSILDQKKEDHVLDCFEVVRSNLRRIFSTLLPGAEADLRLIKNWNKAGDIFLGYGAEIKVAFNGIWKATMTELSGGQRSLLALSFMMSMLKYRATPFYILDEIDAAQDLSHTENLGKVFAENFPNSQFIIISLKEGLYGNSNILYRTSLNDGQSRICRYVLKNEKRQREENQRNSANKYSGGKKFKPNGLKI